MGCERRVVYDLVNVIKKEATLRQALIKDKNSPNLYILPASQTRDKDALTKEGVYRILRELDTMGFDYIISMAHPDNVGSCKTLERVGLEYVKETTLSNGFLRKLYMKKLK